jgi:hypothetical protein
MASNETSPVIRASNGSFEDSRDDDSTASIKENIKKKKHPLFPNQMARTWHSFQGIPSKGSDMMNGVKGGFGMQTDKLCAACKKIPFVECLPGNAADDDDDLNRSTLRKDALIYYKSLSDVLKNRAFCKFCNLLFLSVCQPEYDLLKARHIKEYLPDTDKYKDLKSFPDWVKKNPFWKREWVGGAGIWPFGYAVDREQAANSTLEQAEMLFRKSEERDINTKSLNMNDIKDLYESENAVAHTMTAANASLAIINLATSQKSEGLQKSMASAQFVMGQLAVLQSMKKKRLPCIFMLRAYRKDEEKRGALSVRVYGHGRAPLAPLQEICHFSLRFESSNMPRIAKQQMWYGRTLNTQIDVPFFKYCVETCTSKHDCGEFLSASVSNPTSTPEWDESAIFRLVDVRRMCVTEVNFSNIIHSRSHVRYVALSYRWGTWKWYKNEKGRRYYHNEETNTSTWTRPDSVQLTSVNKHNLSNEHSLEDEIVHLPQTIKDAINVVKAMDERYLWVDQLCIPQEGDEYDRHANIKRMGHIYNRALFTIVAGDSVHADQGLRGLHDRSIRGQQLLEDEIIENARMVLPTRMKLNCEAWEERAWCFQEKLLSRRMLIFSGGFAVWHCRGGTWREDVNALDGDKALISIPWLRLTPLPLPPEISPEGLQTTQKDGSVRLMRLPSMQQYIEAVEDLGRRTIGRSSEILSAFEGLQTILGGRGFLNSPFRGGLPCHFLDVALLWQSDEALCRRRDDDKRCPPSWTWAGWEAAQTLSKSGSQGARVRYEQPFDILILDTGIVRRYRRNGEERIRPRKGTLYGVQRTNDSFSMQELGLFGMHGTHAKVFKDWDLPASEGRPVPKPHRIEIFNDLDDQHLVVNSELATLQLGNDCWKVRTSTKRAGTEHCIITFHDNKPKETASKADEATQPDLQIETVISREHWINTATHLRAGTVKFDAGYDAKRTRYVTAILLSEAQYLGNETTPDVLGYPLYNILLVKRGVKFMERVGLGRIYKYAWQEVGARKEVVVLE